jgi:hypothetical protein
MTIRRRRNETDNRIWGNCVNCPEIQVRLRNRNAPVPNCTMCDAPLTLLSRAASPSIRRTLKSATWEYAKPPVEVLGSLSRAGISYRTLSESDPILDSLCSVLSNPRTHDGIRFRVRGFRLGRPGFAASDFKSVRRLVSKIRAMQNGTERVFDQPPPESDTPSGLGQLLEQELVFRSETVDSPHFSMVKRRDRTNHPLLGVAVSTSSDGSAASQNFCGPVELKTKQSLEDFRSNPIGMVQQMALQAIGAGADAGLLVMLERPNLRTEQPLRFSVLVIENLLEFHLDILDTWRNRNEELRDLLAFVMRGVDDV